MKRVAKRVKEIFESILFSLTKGIISLEQNKLSDEEIAPKLRQHVHIVEKGINENDNNILRIIRGRALFFEARRRNLLSENEIKWCKRILFGGSDSKQKKGLVSKDLNSSDSKQLLDLIKERRSVRSWYDSKLEKIVFEKLVDAGRWAPSSCNRQPWHFIVTSDEEKIKFLSKIAEQQFVEKSPYCLLVLVNKKAYSNEESFKYFSRLDAGAAIQNMLLMGEEIGLGSCWVNLNPANVSDNKKEKIRKKFNIPKSFDIVTFITIGKPEGNPLPPGRKSINNILHFEEFHE